MRFNLPPMYADMSNREVLKALGLLAILAVGHGLIKLGVIFSKMGERVNSIVDKLIQLKRRS